MRAMAAWKPLVAATVLTALVAATALTALVAPIAISPAPILVVTDAPPAPSPTGPLASVEARGGLCPAAICDQTLSLERDGRVHDSARPPNEVGTATAAQVRAVEAAIAATDFAALRQPAFSGLCPTAYDGQELIFEFATAAGTERLSSCEAALDDGDPLFRALAAALGGASPFGPPR
jgi:hypothetical protein